MYIPVEEIEDPDFYREKRLKAEEKERIRLQNECEHLKFMVKCSCCQKVLGSEVNYKRI